jgi:hypothetical protein
VVKETGRCLCGNGSLLLATSLLAVGSRCLLLFFLFFFLLFFALLVSSVLTSGNPHTGVVITLQRLILASQVNTFTLLSLDLVSAALGKVTGAAAEFAVDSSVASDPVGEGVFAVLNDTRKVLVGVLNKVKDN